MTAKFKLDALCNQEEKRQKYSRRRVHDDDSDIELELETENWDEWTGEERDG